MMEVEIEEIGPCRNRLRIALPPDRVTAALDKEFRSLRNTIRIKGFRPGKVPQSYLERRFGTEVAEQVKRDLVTESLKEAVENHRLEPLGSPEVDLAKILLERDQELVFEAVFEVRPSFELGPYTGIAVERPAVEVAEEDIEAELLRVRRRHAMLEPAAADAPPAEQVLFGTASLILGNRKVVTDQPVTIDPGKTTLMGIRVEHLRERALEAGIGATVAFDVTLPSYAADPTLRGQPGKLILALEESKRLVLPAA
ncbi:MAG: hypothetical protein JXQ29_12700, partial [Planctomycetes bacterium]|nr:hypothetical protein [Planctomycetota bacterium]